MSAPYLRAAKKRHADLTRVDWLQGDAADLDFGDDRFDAVFSVFLFHELPRATRGAVLREATRVVKPGAFVGAVDSVQREDVDSLRWALEQFPLSFHEPYFRDYERNPLETAFERERLSGIETEFGFTAKCVSGRSAA